MKKLAKKFIACVLLASICCASAAGCVGTPVEGSEKIDETRTQIYVFNFNGGYGSDWLAEVKRRYEELHKDDVYEDGKKGVQIYINAKKESIMGNPKKVLDNRDEIYFTEYSYYYTLLSEGVLGDITSAVTEPLTEYGEARAVADKLSAEQKNYFGVKEGDGIKYYGLPHYAGYSGLIYNIDLFEEEGYYFAAEPSDNTRDGKFVDKFNTKRSAGPDGVEDTFDDGLPATYEEFFLLCDYIKDGGVTPVMWNGFDYTHYLNNLVQALQADYEGVDQTMLNYTLNGTATTLATVSNGNVTIGEAKAVTETDAYQLARQAGKYYGLSFLEKLVKTESYHNSLAFNSAYSHMNAQEDFLYAGEDGRTAPVAMLCDGVWWEMEAKNVFETMADSKGEAYNKYGRNFGFLPLPRATQEKVEDAKDAPSDAKYTLYDGIYSLCFMKKNVAEWKKPLVLDFIKFVHTDESLREFTTVTNTVKALDYSMTDDDMQKLTTFGKSLVQLKAASKIVYPFSENPTYVNNQSFFMTHEQFRTKIGSSTYQFSPTVFHEKKNITAEMYFNGMETYYRNNWVK